MRASSSLSSAAGGSLARGQRLLTQGERGLALRQCVAPGGQLGVRAGKLLLRLVELGELGARSAPARQARAQASVRPPAGSTAAASRASSSDSRVTTASSRSLTAASLARSCSRSASSSAARSSCAIGGASAGGSVPTRPPRASCSSSSRSFAWTPATRWASSRLRRSSCSAASSRCRRRASRSDSTSEASFSRGEPQKQLVQREPIVLGA